MSNSLGVHNSRQLFIRPFTEGQMPTKGQAKER